MNIFTSKERIINHLYFPIIVSAVLLLLLYLISVIPLENSGDSNITPYLLWCVVFSSFFASSVFKNSKKTAIFSSSIFVLCLMFYAISNRALGFASVVLIAFVLYKLVYKLDLQKFLVLSFSVCAIVGLTLGFCDILLVELAKLLAKRLASSGTVFGIINEIVGLFFSNYFSNLIYYKDYAVSTFINGKITTGVVNAFIANTLEPFSASASFLTGKYYANVILPIAFNIALYPKIKKTFFVPLLFASILSITCGNNILFSIFVLFYNPLMYCGYLFCIALSYLTSYLVDVRIGFEYSASIIELFRYGNNIIYFILIGIVVSALLYFLTRFISSNYDIDGNIYMPKKVRVLFDSLGGMDNIKSLDDNKMIVYNPNLVNILNIDCDISSNTILLNPDDSEIISKYYN